ncbi:helix-turn-helix domain-containing protein [Azospirillum doebereinerae]|uniref:XRE family transcriptional regulator n=1 Tax=Azospirillum doebereinerae TaxID=92933 RepID=A0A433IZN8_9PROT|nr:helix-turn-helix transcriptional regulator [Azospirillum doebereinerae]RUQ61233.1 XRE family transcriptional regulator [Azospirillum doebereinerae]
MSTTPNPLTAWNRLRRQLRRRRSQMGLTQAEVALRGAFGQRSLERWEAGGAGDAEPGAYALLRWCSVLKIELNAVPLDPHDAESETVRETAPEGV